MSKHVMVDLETLGVKPGYSILSIGACVFNPASGEIEAKFYRVIDAKKNNLLIDPNTVNWWKEQSKEAQKVFTDKSMSPIESVLVEFTNWWKQNNGKYFWCHGAVFDAPLLEAAYDYCKMPKPWGHYYVRDTRTIYDIAGVEPIRRGTYHNALDDALTQADAVYRAFQNL